MDGWTIGVILFVIITAVIKIMRGEKIEYPEDDSSPISDRTFGRSS